MRNAWTSVLGGTSIAVMVLLSGCILPEETSFPVEPEVAYSTARYRKEYVLAPGDGLQVVVVKHPELSVSCAVRSDGFISVPLLDDVKAAGLTPIELDRELTRLLSKRLLDPEVTVIATQVPAPSICVVGEVATPQVVPLRVAPTAADAVARSGGFTNLAAQRNVVVIRLTDDGRLMAMMIDPKKMLGQAAPYMALRNVRLHADDIVFVPRSAIAEVTVFIDLHINKVLSGVNSILTTWTQYRLIEVLEAD